MYDYHVHSSFSADCSIDMETMVKCAADIGIKELCFTDHIDQDFKGDASIRFELDTAAYSRRWNEVRQKHSDIVIKKGVEIGLQPHILTCCENIVQGNDFDFVIASLHTCCLQDIHNGDYFSARTPVEAFRQYYEEMFTCVRQFQGFSVLGHLDLPKRYCQHTIPQRAELFFDILEELFANLISRGKGIEVNTSGFRFSANEPLPSPAVLKLYKSLGGEIITVGSDSHFPQHLGYKVQEVNELLKDIGFKYVTTFTRLQPEFKKIP